MAHELTQGRGTTKPGTIKDIDDPRVYELEECLRDGMYMREACAFVGFNTRIIYSTLKQGNIDLRADQPDTVAAQFTLRIQKAMSEAERNALGAIRRAGTNPAFWAANAWYLERRYPEKYGRKDRVALEHSGSVGFNVSAKISLDEVDGDIANAILSHAAIVEDGAIRGPVGFGEDYEPEESGSAPLEDFE